MIIDGRAMAREVLVRAKARAESLGRTPALRVLACGGNAATASYLKMKQKRAVEAGVEMILQEFVVSAHTEDLVRAVHVATEDAIIVQIPLPEGIDTKAVCDAISVEKDADVLSTAARMKFEADEEGALIPPVAGAVAKILKSGGVDPAGKRAVVIGSGRLVGKPCATWLSHAKADVSSVSFRAGDFSALTDADIIISGAGSPHFIKPEMVKDGVVLIDAGTSESGGALAGDADPACADKCSLFTPVPGGVGPLAVAKLFENIVTLAERTTNT